MTVKCVEKEKIQERKELVEEDVEEFVRVLETYFKEEKIWQYKFQYKVKEESSSFLGNPFSPNCKSKGYFENPLEVAYNQLLNKWFFKENRLIQVISERLKKSSIMYTDSETSFIRNLRMVSFSVQ